jgi:hypothetical protein
MNVKPIESARDADLRATGPAMRRAAQRAREVARQTGTPLVVVRQGKVEYVAPDSLAGEPGVRGPESDCGDGK